MKYLIIFLLSLSTFGCASTYTLSKKSAEYRATLTEAKALESVQKYIAKSIDQAGLFSVATNVDGICTPAENLMFVSDGYLVFTADYVVSAGFSRVGNTITQYSEQRNGIMNINLRNIKKIRILAEGDKGGCRAPSMRGYIVEIFNVGLPMPSRPFSAMINVSAENLDQLIAALMFLSPNAQLTQDKGS